MVYLCACHGVIIITEMACDYENDRKNINNNSNNNNDEKWTFQTYRTKTISKWDATRYKLLNVLSNPIDSDVAAFCYHIDFFVLLCEYSVVWMGVKVCMSLAAPITNSLCSLFYLSFSACDYTSACACVYGYNLISVFSIRRQATSTRFSRFTLKWSSSP